MSKIESTNSSFRLNNGDRARVRERGRALRWHATNRLSASKTMVAAAATSKFRISVAHRFMGALMQFFLQFSSFVQTEKVLLHIKSHLFSLHFQNTINVCVFFWFHAFNDFDCCWSIGRLLSGNDFHEMVFACVFKWAHCV